MAELICTLLLLLSVVVGVQWFFDLSDSLKYTSLPTWFAKAFTILFPIFTVVSAVGAIKMILS